MRFDSGNVMPINNKTGIFFSLFVSKNVNELLFLKKPEIVVELLESVIARQLDQSRIYNEPSIESKQLCIQRLSVVDRQKLK